MPKLPQEAHDLCLREDVAALKRLGQSVSFKDFVRLKSGKDSFSRLSLPELVTQMGVSALVQGALTEDSDKAKAYRWMARGLPDWMAVRKVKTDLEVTANTRHSRRRGKRWK